MFIIDWLNTNSGAVQAIAIVVLVGVTWWYAKQTKRIAEATNQQVKATKEQADASVKMAEETMLIQTRPFVEALIEGPGPIKSPDGSVAEGLSVDLSNGGNGPAAEARIYLTYFGSEAVSQRELQPTGLPPTGIMLRVGKARHFGFAAWEIRQDGKPGELPKGRYEIVLSYRDVYGNSQRAIYDFTLHRNERGGGNLVLARPQYGPWVIAKQQGETNDS